VFYRVCFVCWVGGVVLITLSRLDVVSHEVGWAGFYVACVAAVLSYLRWGSGRSKAPEAAILTRDMLVSRNHSFEAAIDHFRRGGAVFHDGLACAVPNDGNLYLHAVASCPPEMLDEAGARREAGRAVQAFAQLASAAPEIGAVAGDRPVCVTLITEFGERGVEICSVNGEQVEWWWRVSGM
jgi:hypothetical protein